MAKFSISTNINLWQDFTVEAETAEEAHDIATSFPFEVRVAEQFRDRVKYEDEDLVESSIDQILCPDGACPSDDPKTKQEAVSQGYYHRNYEPDLGFTAEEFVEAYDEKHQPLEGD